MVAELTSPVPVSVKLRDCMSSLERAEFVEYASVWSYQVTVRLEKLDGRCYVSS